MSNVTPINGLSAGDILFDDTSTGLGVDNVQDAIEAVKNGGGGQTTVMYNWLETEAILSDISKTDAQIKIGPPWYDGTITYSFEYSDAIDPILNDLKAPKKVTTGRLYENTIYNVFSYVPVGMYFKIVGVAAYHSNGNLASPESPPAIFMTGSPLGPRIFQCTSTSTMQTTYIYNQGVQTLFLIGHEFAGSQRVNGIVSSEDQNAYPDKTWTNNKYHDPLLATIASDRYETGIYRGNGAAQLSLVLSKIPLLVTISEIRNTKRKIVVTWAYGHEYGQSANMQGSNAGVSALSATLSDNTLQLSSGQFNDSGRLYYYTALT